MKIENIYPGLPVRTTKEGGIFEVIRIDDVTESVYCNKITSQNADIKEFKAEELIEL